MVVEADLCIKGQSQAVAIVGRESELVLQLSFVEIDTRGYYRYRNSPKTDWLARWHVDSLSAD